MILENLVVSLAAKSAVSMYFSGEGGKASFRELFLEYSFAIFLANNRENEMIPILFFCRDSSKNKDEAIEIMARNLESILENGISNLRNHDVIQIICQYRKWAQSNIKEPSINIVQCEILLSTFLRLSYDDFSRGCMAVARNGKFVEKIFEGLRAHVVLS